MDNVKIQKLQSIIDNSQRIVFFGGAGVSTESGIPDFRSVYGLYNLKYKYPPEQILSRQFFWTNPEEFYRFYRDKLIIPEIKPNIAHIKLAELEKAGKLSAIVTQNIDDLHYLAGSETVYELHGTTRKYTCTKCKKKYGVECLEESKNVPVCHCGGIIKPDVVLYGEGLDQDVIEGAIDAIYNADTLIIAGTSLTVYPAAGLVDYFRGDNLVLINRDSTPMDKKADLVIHDKIGQVLEQITVEV